MIECNKHVCSCGKEIIHRDKLTPTYLKALLIIHYQLTNDAVIGMQEIKMGKYITLDELKKKLRRR